MSSSRRSLRLRKISINPVNDPIARLPDLCIDAIFSYFSPAELIGIQRVSKTWRDNVNWCFSRVMYQKQWFPPLGTDNSNIKYSSWEEAAVAFRRAAYCHEMRKRGEPTFIRKFTNADQGWAVCGDYFVWIDANFINVQLVFDAQNPGRMVRPIQRFSLRFLSQHDDHDSTNTIRMLDVQEIGGAGGQPLLALVILSRTKASPFLISKVAVMDVVKGKLLWCLKDPKRSVCHCTLNRSVLSYVQYPNPAHDMITGEFLLPSLVVLDVLTGALKSNTKFHLERSSFEIRAIRAHPCRELIFILLSSQIMVFSTATMDWVGVLELLAVSTSGGELGGDYTHLLSGGTWELQFDEYEPKSGAPDKVSVCGLRCQVSEPGPLRTNYFVIQSFELPSAEELEAANVETAKDRPNEENTEISLRVPPKSIKTWKRLFVEILDATDVMPHPMMLAEVNIRAKQVAVMLPSSNFKSNKAIIYTYKQETSVPETFPVSAVPRRNWSVGRKGKGKEEPGVEFRWFTPSVKSEITKMRKNLPKDTPYANRRMPAWFSGVRGLRGPQLREKYMVFHQRTDVFLLSFAPAW